MQAKLTECGPKTDGPVPNGYFSRTDNKLNTNLTYDKLYRVSRLCPIGNPLQLATCCFLSFQASDV